MNRIEAWIAQHSSKTPLSARIFLFLLLVWRIVANSFIIVALKLG
jgi:hypothetical protein